MIADICVIGIVAFFVFIGYRAGMMKALIKFVSYILALVISFLLYPYVADFLIETPVYDAIFNFIDKNYISQTVLEATQGDRLGILSNYLSIENMTTGFSQAATVLLINIITFIILVILSRIILHLIANTLNLITKLPIIKSFNRLGGAVIGGVVGVVVLYIIGAVIVFTSSFNTKIEISKQLEKSVFASEVYNNNIILLHRFLFFVLFH